MENQISDEMIQELPKTDLHVHLDGSLRLSTLIELAREYNIALPSETEEGLRETVFKERYNDLSEYLEGFRYTVAVLQTEEALERTAYELAWDNLNEGVRYIEPRFAPQLHLKGDIARVLVAVNKGLARAKHEFNSRPSVEQGEEPPFEYGIIVSAMRMFESHYSEYYANLLSVHSFSDPKIVFGMASLELAQAVVRLRDEYGLPIVGFDLAGQENGYPAGDHIEAYQYAHQHFLKKTVHAGEAYGPESIFQAITALHADRIGHGYHLFSPWLLSSKIMDKQKYIRELAEYISDRRITVEICLTSNLQTNPSIRSLSHHSFLHMLHARMSATFCTDNRLVSNTTVSREISLAIKHFHLSQHSLKHYIIYGFKRNFFPGSYLQKRRYVRRIIDYYEAIERKYGLQS